VKRQFDITYTVEMSDKAYKRLGEAEDGAADNGQTEPLWAIGLDAVDCLRLYGVKAKLVQWGFRRNALDIARQT
jgi:hypothetical protein